MRKDKLLEEAQEQLYAIFWIFVVLGGVVSLIAKSILPLLIFGGISLAAYLAVRF